MNIDVQPDVLEAVVVTPDIIATPSSTEICTVENTELEVFVSKREFNIVGDNVYIGASSEEAPQWLGTAIDNAVTLAMYGSKVEYDRLLAELNIAKNIYFEQVNIAATIDSVIASHLTTLNATVATASGNIVNLELVKTTKDQVVAEINRILDASLLNGAIHAQVATIETAIANGDLANATSISALTATFNDNIARIDNTAFVASTDQTALAARVTNVEAAVPAAEARIIQSYTVYVDQNISYDVRIYSSRGSLFRKLDTYTELSCRVFKGNVEVTNSIGIPSFVWQRVSNDVGDDIAWNNNHPPSKTLTVTPADVNGRADFTCIVTITI